LLEEDLKPRKRKTENRSFRLDATVLEGLEDEAARKKVSVNTLVSQLLANYVETDRHTRRIGDVNMNANVFKLLFNAVSEKGLLEAAAWGGANVPKAYVLSKWGTLTLDHLMSYIKENAGSSGLYDYSETGADKKSITLTHTLGMKWSEFLSIYMKLAFQTFGQKVECEYNEQAIAIRL
jgi:hypothetical protein